MRRTTPFKQVFNKTARWMGFNPNKEVPPEEREAIVDRINDRVRTAWTGWPWPEWTVTEQRAFRSIWNSEHQYSVEGANGKPDEVFYLGTQFYYRVIADLDEDPPVGTLPTDTLWWEEFNLLDSDTYVEYDQVCRRSIGQVRGVFQHKPSCNDCNGAAGPLNFHPAENGVQVCHPGSSTVFIQYKMPVPRYSMVPYAEGRTYQRADVVFDTATGECFQALVATSNAPSTSDWAWMPFLEVWEKFVTNGAFADKLSELSQEGNAETQLLELKAIRIERRADEALEDEVAALREQGQMMDWPTWKCKGYWCESLPWSGGDVSELTDECEFGIVFPNPPGPPTPAPGFHCPLPGECPDLFYISQPNVAQNVNTFPGIRLGSREVDFDYAPSVVDFASLVDASVEPRTSQLPLATGSGQIYYFQKRDDTTNTVTILPQTGDLINGQPSWILGLQYMDVTIIDAALGEWVKFGSGTGEIPGGIDLSDFARKSVANVFLALNTFTGVRFNTRTINEDDTALEGDFGILVQCTDAPIALQLPAATGSGQMFYVEKIDSTDEVVTINVDGTDLFGPDGAVSINFVERGDNALLFDSALGYWSNIGGLGGGGSAAPDFGANFRVRDLDPIHGVAFDVRDVDDTTWIEQERFTEPSSGPLPASDVSFFWKPEINDTTELAAFPTLGLLENSRIDCYFASGLVSFLFKTGPADGGDPGQVDPDDYDLGTHDFHWEQIM